MDLLVLTPSHVLRQPCCREIGGILLQSLVCSVDMTELKDVAGSAVLDTFNEYFLGNIESEPSDQVWEFCLESFERS